jgi:hypothetical protein
MHSSSAWGCYFPWTQNVGPNVHEWLGWGKPFGWEVCHFLLLKFPAQFPTIQALIDNSVYKAFPSNA